MFAKTKGFLEKRSHSRVPVQIPVQVKQVTDQKEIERLKGKTGLAKDLSLAGMFLKLPGLVKAGDVVRLDISLPQKGHRQLFAFAEVVRVTAKGSGLKLLLMPQEDREDLGVFLERVPTQAD